MMDLVRSAVPLVPWAVGLYGIAFLSGGVYYLEQRVARIRDQMPDRAALARIYGLLALLIGLLALASAAGYLVLRQSEARLAALVAIVAGVGFWLHRLRTALTIGSRVRAGSFAVLCALLAGLGATWLQM